MDTNTEKSWLEVEMDESVTLSRQKLEMLNKEDAEDLTNSIFVAIFEYLGKNINIQKLDNLIWKIAYNLWCKKIRNKKKDELLVEIKEDELIDVDWNIIDKIINKDISKNFDKIGLTNTEMKVFKLYYYNDFNIKEINKLLLINENNIKYYLYNARKKIKEKFNE